LFKKDTGGLMKKVLFVAILIIIPLLVIRYNFSVVNRSEEENIKKYKALLKKERHFSTSSKNMDLV